MIPTLWQRAYDKKDHLFIQSFIQGMGQLDGKWSFFIRKSNQQFYLIFLQPVIHLQKIRKQLRTSHELPIERPAVVGGLADVVEHFIQVNQFPQGCARVGQCFHDRGAQQIFVSGIIGFGIRTLSAV